MIQCIQRRKKSHPMMIEPNIRYQGYWKRLNTWEMEIQERSRIATTRSLLFRILRGGRAQKIRGKTWNLSRDTSALDLIVKIYRLIWRVFVLKRHILMGTLMTCSSNLMDLRTICTVILIAATNSSWLSFRRWRIMYSFAMMNSIILKARSIMILKYKLLSNRWWIIRHFQKILNWIFKLFARI